MNFFGVGPAELVVILVVALIFVGPERLPRLAADIARTIREIRSYTGNIAAEFGEVLQEFEKDTAEDRSKWKEIGEGLTDATKSITDAVRQAHADASGAPAADATPPVREAPSTGEAPPAAAAPPVPEPATNMQAIPEPGAAAANGAHATNGASEEAPAEPAAESR